MAEVNGRTMPELAAYLFAASGLCMLVLTPLAIRLGNRWGVLDVPGPRKIHSNPVPMVGGWAIFAAISLVLWGHIFAALAIRGTELETRLPGMIRYFLDRLPQLIHKILPVYAGATCIFFLGLYDDLKGMSVKSRLLFQIAIATGLAAMGLRPSLQFLPAWIGMAVGIVWIVGITNAFNFIDGLDGLSTGVALVGSLALLTVMGIGNQPDVVFLLAALAGIQLVFLRFNFHPASVFLGSSGSLLSGYMLATSTLLVTYMRGNFNNWLMPLLTPLFILAIPIYDTTSVVLIRLIQKRSIAIGDQSHFHHRLLRLGFSHRQAVAFILLIAFSVALSAVRLVHSTLLEGGLILLQILGILSLIIIAERVAIKARTEILKRKETDNAPDRVMTESLSSHSTEHSRE